MKYRSLAALASVLGMAACNEIITSPEQSVVRAPSFAIDNPPPPPSDRSAVGEVMFGDESGFRTSSAGNAFNPPVTPSGITFPLNVRYFFNRPGNSGWLVLPMEQDGAVSMDKEGRVRYQKGVFLGSGKVEVDLGAGGFLIFDLVNVSTQSSSFASCDATAPSPTATSGQPARPEGGCFYLEINRATLDRRNGQPPETVTVAIREPCVVDAHGDHCIPAEG